MSRIEVKDGDRVQVSVPPSVELFIDAHPAGDAILEDVLEGLSSNPKRLPAKLFYDAEGSRLFDRICELEEYYPTRTETGIMQAGIGEMARIIGADAAILEYGSGSSTKTEILLAGLESPASYLPVDISRDHLLMSAARIASRHPCLNVLPVCADYTQEVPELHAYAREHRTVVYFPGSTIGNFDPEHAQAFLRSVSEAVGPAGGLLIGVDLKKDPDVLIAAYDDREGVTAAFNMNMLRHINHQLGTVFDVGAFRHEALWNDAEGRIEMHLRASRRQSISLGGTSFVVEAGESIVTEHSHKYSVEGFSLLAESSGFESSRVWIDPQELFSVHYLVAR
jgi:L-histidine Nalpha-methyltransferase